MFSGEGKSPAEEKEYDLEFAASSFYPECNSQSGMKESNLEPEQQIGHHMGMETVKDKLMQQTQQIVEELNEKRQKDGIALMEFKEAVHDQIDKYFATLEKAVQDTYVETSKAMEKQLKKISATADRCEKMQKEIEEIKSASPEE